MIAQSFNSFQRQQLRFYRGTGKGPANIMQCTYSKWEKTDVSVGGEIWQIINTVRERKTLPVILKVHVKVELKPFRGS
jgi:hypothetical protein